MSDQSFNITTPMRPMWLDRACVTFLAAAAGVAILVTVGIVLSLVFETIQFFDKVPMRDFLFGLKWSPQTSIRADQVGSGGSFGIFPLINGTLLISAISMIVATPLGLTSAVYLSEYSSKRARAWIKPALEILAGIPTVVYGFFAALTLAPFIRMTGGQMGLEIASESAQAAGNVMGIMIVPLFFSLSDDVINSVPQSLRDVSLGLGATQSKTIRRVILPAALPGISGSLLLATSRAIGETMIVLMAAGMAAKLTLNPLDAVTTITVQIVALLTGDQEFDSAKTLSAFALGFFLFVITHWLTASDDLDLYLHGKIDTTLPEKQRQISDSEIIWIADLQTNDQLRRVTNWNFLTGGDNREPEIAGILSAFVGSLYSLAVCFALT